MSNEKIVNISHAKITTLENETLQEVAQQIPLKVDKVEGRGLSSNDYTSQEKSKLSEIESGAQVNTVNSVAGKFGDISLIVSDIPDAVSVSDERLTNPRTPTSHTHGNLSNNGAIGSDPNLPLLTTTNGVVTTGAFGTGATNFTKGNDPRLSDARTPTAHDHLISEVANLQNALDSKVSVTNGNTFSFFTVCDGSESGIIIDCNNLIGVLYDGNTEELLDGLLTN